MPNHTHSIPEQAQRKLTIIIYGPQGSFKSIIRDFITWAFPFVQIHTVQTEEDE